MKNKLIIVVGLSASGKSHIAKELSEKHDAIIISSDAIRKEICGTVEYQSKNEEVFKIFHKRIKEYLSEGINVIADATNITIKSRRAILENVKKFNIEKICIVCSKKIEDCIKDNLHREYPVPEHVIEKQMKRFQIPFYKEGFDKIIIQHNKCGVKDNKSLSEICHSMSGFKQYNPHHNMTLDHHCEFVHKLFSENNGTEVYENPFYIGAKLHDVGKLYTQSFDENNIAHYYCHENVGAYYVLTNMHIDNWKDDMLLDCCFLINYHMFPFSWETNKTKNKWKKVFGEEKYEMLIRFHICDKSKTEYEIRHGCLV